ncbi:MAG: DUF262 domain-containing protein [Methylococcales bacterium]
MKNAVESKIITVKEMLLNDKLKVPEYQRPYKWTIKNVNQLIDDIIFHKDKSAYRLGTLVLHREDKSSDEKSAENIIDNIVDGQQRALTLTLIAYALDLEQSKFNSSGVSSKNFKLLQQGFTSDISQFNLQNNFKEIKRRIHEFGDDGGLINFFYEKCQLVQVVLTDISEAFQFFDSQNSRGKDLEPHDLLKAFHLREMASLTDAEKKKTVDAWEKIPSTELVDLFGLYLYRIRQWSNSYSARYFTKDDVGVFKGVNPQNERNYPYAQLSRIGYFYTESYNRHPHRLIDNQLLEYPFQIDQTIINGKCFFEMIAHYHKLTRDIKNWFDETFSNQDIQSLNASLIPKSDFSKKIQLELRQYEGRHRTGDKYVKELFHCYLIYYVDKFGSKGFDKAIEKAFFWAYALRLKMYAVHIATIDNYALGVHDSPNQGQAVFKLMREALNPSDVLNIQLKELEQKSDVQQLRETGVFNLFFNIQDGGDKNAS